MSDKESQLIFQQEILDYLKTTIALGEEQDFLNKVQALFPSMHQQLGQLYQEAQRQSLQDIEIVNRAQANALAELQRIQDLQRGSK